MVQIENPIILEAYKSEITNENDLNVILAGIEILEEI